MTQKLGSQIDIVRGNGSGSMAIRLGESGTCILGISCWKVGDTEDPTYSWPFEHGELLDEFKGADPALAAQYQEEREVVTSILMDGGEELINEISAELLRKGCSKGEVAKLRSQMLEYYLKPA